MAVDCRVNGRHARSEVLRQMYGRTHNSYKNAKARTRVKPGHRDHRYYAGVRMCARWADTRTGYAAFVADLGFRPGPAWSIDRINPAGHYSCGQCPDCVAHGWAANVEWGTPVTQAWRRRFRAGVSSLYPGVSWRKREGLWAAQISRSGRYMWLGYHASERAAAEAYRMALAGAERDLERPTVITPGVATVRGPRALSRQHGPAGRVHVLREVIRDLVMA